MNLKNYAVVGNSFDQIIQDLMSAGIPADSVGWAPHQDLGEFANIWSLPLGTLALFVSKKEDAIQYMMLVGCSSGTTSIPSILICQKINGFELYVPEIMRNVIPYQTGPIDPSVNADEMVVDVLSKMKIWIVMKEAVDKGSDPEMAAAVAQSKEADAAKPTLASVTNIEEAKKKQAEESVSSLVDSVKDLGRFIIGNVIVFPCKSFNRTFLEILDRELVEIEENREVTA